MEKACWARTLDEAVASDAPRVYLGHESCPDLLPARQPLLDAVLRLRDAGRRITLVTPFVTERETVRIRALIESLSRSLGRYEVVCSDWGLLRWLAASRLAEPVVGRLLAGQATDPRLAALDQPARQRPHERIVHHADGTAVRLRYRRPTQALMTHLRGCSLDDAEVLPYLAGLGVGRFEVSNLLQGLRLSPPAGWKVTLHVPEVPLAIARRVWVEPGSQWLHPTFPVPLHRRENVLFYRHSRIPANAEASGIDRVVYQAGAVVSSRSRDRGIRSDAARRRR